MIKIVLVDDHILLRNGLAVVINSFGDYEVVFQADNGKQFIELLYKFDKPDIVLLDISMPEMNGYETAAWIKQNEPEIKILVLSMMDNDNAIIRMLKNGAKGYILKDSKPEVLKAALKAVAEQGFFFNEQVNGKLVNLASDSEVKNTITLNEAATEFLKLCCTEKSYKEIADTMGISTRKVEFIRSKLFEDLDTISRVGLVIYAIKNGLFTL